MKIGGIQNLTLIDYPGEVAATIFVNGCNFRCPFCHNPDLVYGGEKFMSTEQVLQHIKSRKDFYSGICISGGEPTIYEEKLTKLACDIKNMGLKVKLDTNGSNPGLLKEMLKANVLDYVAIDVKSIPSLLQSATGTTTELSTIQSSIKAVMGSKIKYEIRSTFVPNLFPLEKLDELKEILNEVECYYIQQFNNNTLLLDNAYKNIIPYTKEDLLKAKDHLKKYVKDIKLR